MFWTKEREGQLSGLWEEGLTAKQIAERIGEGVTRNAVIGKANRMRLQRRREGRVRVGEELSYVLMDGLGRNMCQWPVKDFGVGEFGFCGAKVEEGKSYCTEHMAEAYRGPVMRERKAS